MYMYSVDVAKNTFPGFCAHLKRLYVSNEGPSFITSRRMSCGSLFYFSGIYCSNNLTVGRVQVNNNNFRQLFIFCVTRLEASESKPLNSNNILNL